MRPIMMFTLDPDFEFEDYGEFLDHIASVAYSEATNRGVTLPDTLQFKINRENTVVAVYDDNLEDLEADPGFYGEYIN